MHSGISGGGDITSSDNESNTTLVTVNIVNKLKLEKNINIIIGIFADLR